MAGADALAREELAAIAANGLLRSLEPLRTGAGAEVELASGERLVSFSSNDYLGLASHAAVRQALADGARQWGLASGRLNVASVTWRVSTASAPGSGAWARGRAG